MSAATATPRHPWLFGPWPDLLLGCGLGYVALLAWLATGAADSLHPAIPALLVVGLSAPHYGATLLRVYERRSDRRSYAIFSVWATVAVVAAVAAGVFYIPVAVFLYTLYITWSPWHYSGQNYGIAVMFLRRRGAPLEPRAKRLLHLSFVCSFAVTFLALHSASGSLDYSPNAVPYDETAQLAQGTLGIPLPISRVLLVGALAGYLGSLVGAFALLRRHSGWSDLLPAGALVMSQALWFVIPFSVGFFHLRTGIAPFDRLDHYVLWTALAHAVQYLWITSYYARAEANWTSQSRYLAKTLAAGVAVWTLPVIVFSPDLTGGIEYVAGLGLLTAAGVNLHHFILDGAIWKLRNTRIASVLIRAVRDDERAAIERAPWRHWLGRGVWAVCGASVALTLASIWWETKALGDRLRGGDLAGAETILDRLAWVGRDNSDARFRLASAWNRAGDADRATVQLERSLVLRPSERTWVALASVAAQEGDWERVLAVYDRARSAIAAGSGLDQLAVRAWYARGEPDRGRELMRESAARDPRSAEHHAALAGLARELGDWSMAVHYYQQTLAIQPDRRSAANNLAWVLATADDPAVRDPELAIDWASRALEGLEPADPNLLDTLAVAYAAAGRRSDAIVTATRAVGLAREQKNEQLAAEIEARLAVLREGDAPGAAHTGTP